MRLRRTWWPVGTFDLLIPFWLLWRVIFDKIVFRTLIKKTSILDFDKAFFFENFDLLFSTTLGFNLTCIFSMRDLISTFQACFASSFGDKMLELFTIGLFRLKSLDFNGSRWRVIWTVEFMTSRILSNFKIVHSYSLWKILNLCGWLNKSLQWDFCYRWRMRYHIQDRLFQWLELNDNNWRVPRFLGESLLWHNYFSIQVVFQNDIVCLQGKSFHWLGNERSCQVGHKDVQHQITMMISLWCYNHLTNPNYKCYLQNPY